MSGPGSRTIRALATLGALGVGLALPPALLAQDSTSSTTTTAPTEGDQPPPTTTTTTTAPTTTTAAPPTGSGTEPRYRARTANAVAKASGVTIEDFDFAPKTISISVGDTVTWTNKGPSDHTATADDGEFDSGTLTQDQSFSHTFQQAGTFTYVCTIHPSMKGTVQVSGGDAGGAGGTGGGDSGSGGGGGTPSGSSSPPTGGGSESAGTESPTASGTSFSLPTTGQAALPLGLAGGLLLVLGGLLRGWARRASD